MAEPDWIGNPPEEPFLSADGSRAYFQRKEDGKELRSLWSVPLAGGPMEKLSPAAAAAAESSGRIFSADRSQVAWLRGGHLFLWSARGAQQLTRTGDATDLLTFLPGGEVAFRAGERLLAVAPGSGLVRLLATLKTVDDPDKPKPAKDYVGEAERRLLEAVRQRETRRLEKVAQEREVAAQAASAPRPIYFGKDKAVRTVSLSPDGRRLLVGITAAELRGRRERMPAYVTADAYIDPTEVRTKVGTDKPMDETLYLLDLPAGERRKLALADLPGIKDDPLAELNAAAAARKKAKAAAQAKEDGEEEPKSEGKTNGKAESAAKDAAKPKLRATYVHGAAARGVRWTKDGAHVAICLFAYDNKDRWLAEIDWTGAKAGARHRLTDPAWVNDSAFNEFDWLPDGAGLWYTSEETGYSHLYVRRGETVTALTRGKFEVNAVQIEAAGGWFYYRANRTNPGRHEVYRVRWDGTGDETVTALGGSNTYELSRDGRQLLIVNSTVTRPPELYAQAAQPGATARRQTTTVSAAFAALVWPEPETILVPSRAGGDPVYARVYGRAAAGAGAERRPAVMFVHGAGYLQNVHAGWSQYFREFMFHQLLVQRGFVVIDLDYRGSAGYGRDWRTAIYRRMGTPELEDYLDGIEWLVGHAQVDRARIGIYGGSYGGFLTLMGLFKEPAVFAAGAALRPVTDWAHYNHSYTSNILNTPEVDPEAYTRSSPIEFAAGLRRPLLISHGMLDDNVFFQDSVRLVQRLIELKKESFEIAMFPVEAHGFRDAVSWLDQYRRILRLMEREVKDRPATP
jgi:dipeptidyl aminopeptidase/acylaminoacyl peptidase